MKFERAYIPYGAYWSTPFSKWQGSLAHLHAVKLAAESAKQALERSGIPVDRLGGLHLGITVPQRSSFYGAPWLAALMGAEGITGPTISQACATSARCVAGAASEVELGAIRPILAIACDRTSNGPHLYHPNPLGPGGKGASEDWVWDNFTRDPFARCAMVDTAENVAKAHGFTREAQEQVSLLRQEQYAEALADDRAFQRRYMLPLEVKNPAGRGKITVDADEGIFPATAEGQAKLKPMVEGGTVTFATQTHPADGNAGLIVTTKDEAASLATDAKVTVRLLSFAEGRAKKAHMPEAILPSTRAALEAAGVGPADLKAIKTHNPFAVNDLLLSKELGVSLDAINRYGCSLIYGHPQGPTGLRGIVELIEELVLAGGGAGLFTGCAAGDTAASVVLRVDC